MNTIMTNRHILLIVAQM